MDISKYCIKIKRSFDLFGKRFCIVDIFTDSIDSVFLKIAKENDVIITKYDVYTKSSDHHKQVLIFTMKFRDTYKLPMLLEKLHDNAKIMGHIDFEEYSEKFIRDFNKSKK